MRQGSAGEVFPTRAERKFFIEGGLSEKARTWIEGMVQEELEIALGVDRYERGPGRRGHRKGFRSRQITTSLGKKEFRLPRGEYFEPTAGGKREWQSKLVPRYARRTGAVEEALVSSYLCGANTRKIRRLFSPRLQGAALSKSTVSRLRARLEESFQAWRSRDLSGESIAIVFLDGFDLKMRLAGKVHSIPVLAAVGVGKGGRKVLLALEARTSESAVAWKGATSDLARRGLKAPVLAVIDGSAGLFRAVRHTWPWIDVQRCTKHKLENLYTHPLAL